MKRRKFLWVITIVWAIIIFCFSGQTAEQSKKISTTVSDKVVEIVPELKTELRKDQEMLLAATKVIVRKIAHGVLFFVLAILVLPLLQTYPKMLKFAYLAAFIICVLYAAGDELHQHFVPGRAALLADMGIDAAGSFLGLSISYVIKKLSPV